MKKENELTLVCVWAILTVGFFVNSGILGVCNKFFVLKGVLEYLGWISISGLTIYFLYKEGGR